MGFELPNGKTARNIQEQVAFLTEKVKELFAAVSDLGFKVVKVEELPEEGAARTIYLMPSSDPETANMYDEYIWTEDGWEKIGSTDIDLSNYVDLTSDQTIGGNKSFSGVASFIGGANFNGPIKTPFYPQTSNSYDLGLSSYTWRNLYLGGSIYIANTILIEGTDGNFVITLSGDDKSFRPSWGGHYNLGTPGYQWKDIYLSEFIEFKNPDTSKYWRIYVDNAQNLIIQSSTNRTTWTNVAFWNANGALNLLSNSLYLNGTINDTGGHSVSVADLAALIDYARAQGWIS